MFPFLYIVAKTRAQNLKDMFTNFSQLCLVHLSHTYLNYNIFSHSLSPSLPKELQLSFHRNSSLSHSGFIGLHNI